MNYRYWIRSTVVGMAFAWAVWAQTQSSGIGVPVLGYVHDAGISAVRPLYGIPGASLLGNPYDLPWPVTAMAAAPGHALVLAGDGSGAWLVRDGAAVAISGLPAQPTDLALSPSGSAAVFRNREWNRIDIVTGLPDQPRLSRSLDAHTVSLEGLLAISDDGALLLAASSDGLLLCDEAGGIEKIGSGARAIAFRPASHEFVIVFDGDRVVWRDRQGSYLRQWGPDEGIATVAAAHFQSDGGVLWIAGLDGRLLATSRAGESQHGICDCRPDRIQPLAGGAVALTGISPQPLLIATSRSGLKVLFVPAVETGDQTR
jgi:hypothetical protein